jgi:hypothetical protein
MQPLVQQHLLSLRKVLNEVVIPALGDNAFAAEQAGLISASLALLAEVQPYEDDYLRQEHADLQAGRAALGLPAVPACPDHRDALADAVWRLKAEQHARLDALAETNGGALPEALRKMLAPLLDRQLAREAAWSRLTGFNPAGASLPPIAAVLARQRETHA